MTVIDLGNKLKSDYRYDEAYKTFRTNLQLCGDDTKIIMITSSTSDEGKSSVSVNLAITLAETGNKVIFIDADLRKSEHAKRFRVSKKVPGLSHFLSGINKFEDVVCGTTVDNLQMILAGAVPPNPSELLDNKKFDALLKALRNTYDYVVVDTPPLINITDATIVAQKCDGAVLVVSAHQVSKKLVQKAVDQLKFSKCRILGAVLNKVEFSSNSIYGNYYGKYYGRYYGKYYGKYGNEGK